MKLDTISFFTINKEHPVAHCQYGHSKFYSASVHINKSIDNQFNTPSIDFYMSLSDLIAFKNSVVSSFEKAMREAGYGK